MYSISLLQNVEELSGAGWVGPAGKRQGEEVQRSFFGGPLVVRRGDRSPVASSRAAWDIMYS